MKKLIMILPLALLCGCANTRLRMSVADFDFRKPAQITAGQYEAGVIYEAGCQDAAVKAPEPRALPLAFYEKLFEMIAKLECRLRLFSFESSPVGVR